MSKFLIKTTTKLNDFGKLGAWMFVLGPLVTLIASSVVLRSAGNFDALMIGAGIISLLSIFLTLQGLVMVIVEREHQNEVTVLTGEQ
jgi:hypothetical protein